MYKSIPRVIGTLELEFWGLSASIKHNLALLSDFPGNLLSSMPSVIYRLGNYYVVINIITVF